MEVFLMSLFSIIIICITVISIIKVLNIALNRKEISKQKHKLFMTSIIVSGIILTIILPVGYIGLFKFIL